MAQKVNIILTDDLDGGEATETVRFALDGGQFEIDLSAENAQALRESVRPFKDKARQFLNTKRTTPLWPVKPGSVVLFEPRDVFSEK